MNKSIHNKKDSQGICFVGKIKFKDFIRKFIKPKPGLIKDMQGKIIGKHDGLAFYTIGQRHGLGIGGGYPFYVSGKDKRNNILVIARGNTNKALFKKELNVKNLHWISSKKPKLPIKVRARIRYRQPLQNCIFMKDNKVVFKNPQRAITSGQFIVFYIRGKMLGGGIIK